MVNFAEGHFPAPKMDQKMAEAMMNSNKNSVACGDCCGVDGNSGYGPIASCDVVTTILIQWLEEDRGLAGGEPKWLQH